MARKFRAVIQQVHLYANMTWFSVAEQPTNFDLFPENFRKAADLLSANQEQNFALAATQLSPFLGASFVSENIPGLNRFFVEPQHGEFQAYKTKIAGLDFSESPIPLCKAEGYFSIPLSPGVDLDSLYEHLDSYDYNVLTDAVCFFWSIEEFGIENYDLTFASHSGCECWILEELP